MWRQILLGVERRRNKGLSEMIEVTGATLLYLPLYSPDFNPIENDVRQAQSKFAKGRRTHRPAVFRTLSGASWLHPTGSTNYFAAPGSLQPDPLTL